MSNDGVLIVLHFGGKFELDKAHLNYSGGNEKKLRFSNSLTYQSLIDRVLEETNLMQDEPFHIQCLMQEEPCHSQYLHQSGRAFTLMSIKNDEDIDVMLKACRSWKDDVHIYASQGNLSKEEHFQAFFRKIESVEGLKNNLKDRVKRVKESLMSSTIALSMGKGMENGVLEELAESIRKIDDLSESCESNISQSESQAHEEGKKKSHELEMAINHCIQKIEYHMALFKKGKILLDKNNNGVNRPQHLEPVPERWLTKAEEKVKGNLPVTYPKMRYNDLEPPLRRCLLFLSVFPKDAVVKKKTIIYWWIGEGLVKPNKAQTAEQAGEQCFKMLLLNGLILPILKNHDKEARCWKLDSSVHQMLSSRVEEAGLCFKTYSNDILTGEKGEHPLSCLTATENEQSVMVSLEHNTGELLSLFNISAQYLVCDSEKFRTFKLIKVLQLGRWQISSNHHIEVSDTKFLESLGVMKNLRYLSLQGISRITMLPESLVNLTNLQILDLRACHNLETLPTGIAMLKNLTHLDASECSLLDRMPKGLASLSELQVLKGFIISERTIHDSCRLKDLSGLKKLKKLSINIAKGANANDDLKESNRFTALKSLTITWGKVSELEISLPKLVKLDLQCIRDEKLNWLKPEGFPDLKKLYIRGGKLESLNLGTTSETRNVETNSKTWNVETLRLKFLSKLKWNKWSEIQNAFPSLACIEIYNCPELEAKDESLPPFPGVDGVWIMNNEASSSDMASSSSSRGKMD